METAIEVTDLVINRGKREVLRTKPIDDFNGLVLRPTR